MSMPMPVPVLSGRFLLYWVASESTLVAQSGVVSRGKSSLVTQEDPGAIRRAILMKDRIAAGACKNVEIKHQARRSER